ncbi:MAG: hypothetical protein ANABAC_1916 [Anaerolineae bacterium]|nr:MAG: hypothetical protein ANABAC_1916 [Anaerolineae bacterium]
MGRSTHAPKPPGCAGGAMMMGVGANGCHLGAELYQPSRI